MPEWFAPKRFGFGCGYPIAWQGWALSALLTGIVTLAAILFADRLLVLLSIILQATALFMLVAARTTRGGWHWRNGGDQ